MPCRSTGLLLALVLLAAPAARSQESDRGPQPETAPQEEIGPGGLGGVEVLTTLTPIGEIRLSPEPLDHPAPDPIATRSEASPTLADLRELRMEQGWSPSTVHWQATNFWHRPLYFEDVLLERHGQTRFWQPAWSAVHFFGTLPTLPYKMGLQPPCEKVYTLGYYRPGNCHPPLRRTMPWEADAAALEAGAVVGALLLLP